MRNMQTRTVVCFFSSTGTLLYNPREKSWMGWSGSAARLLDLNKLLREQYDSFPVKSRTLNPAECSICDHARFRYGLPRGSAHRMIGTMAHPLNQAIIDPASNTVVDGYGILQPRVGVSVQSTSRSRLAAITRGRLVLIFIRGRFLTRIRICTAKGASRGKGFMR